MPFVSKTCEGERCHCGQPAVKKVGEEIPFDDPDPARHNLTAYVCERHYAELMGPVGAKQVGLTRAPVSQDAEQLVDCFWNSLTRQIIAKDRPSVRVVSREQLEQFTADLIEALTRPQPSTSSVEAVARAELLEWASQHSNVTPLDGTDRDSPTFGDLRAALAPPPAQSGDRT